MSESLGRPTSGANGIVRVWIWRTSYRPILSGTPISISRSNLPGRLRAGYDVEVRVGFIRHRLRQQGFPAARRPVQKDSFWRFDSESLEELWMPQWKLDHFPNSLDLAVESTDILVGDNRYALLLWCGLAHHLDNSRFCDFYWTMRPRSGRD